MLSKKPLILALAIAFSAHCSSDQAQENRLPLLFPLTIGKALIYTPKPFIEVLFTKRVFVRDANVLTLSDIACFSRFGGNKRPEEPEEEGIEEESEAIEWWELKLGVQAKVYRRSASDEGSGSEDSSASDKNNKNNKNSDNPSDEDEADVESDVQHLTTTTNPFRASNEISQYCEILALNKIKQESVSDSERSTGPEGDVTGVHSVNQLEMTLPVCSTNRTDPLKTHKPTQLIADQSPGRPKRPIRHQCDHEGCNFSTIHAGNINRHKKTHLPADQRHEKSKVLQCGHEGCNYRTDHGGNLKKHKQIHLPADQRPKRPKVHQCDHKGCNYRTDNTGYLKTHKRTHLPAHQRIRGYQCDHEGCNYSTDHKGNLKMHKKIHLLPVKRLKRKAYAQPPSNEKRKKGVKG